MDNQEILSIWRRYGQDYSLPEMISFWLFREFVLSSIGAVDLDPRYKNSEYHNQLLSLVDEIIKRYREESLQAMIEATV